MLPFKTADTIPAGAIERLREIMKNMRTFGRACYGEISLPDEPSSPAILVECGDTQYRSDAEIISEEAADFFRSRGVLNIVPVPPGPWWEQIVEVGEVIR